MGNGGDRRRRRGSVSPRDLVGPTDSNVRVGLESGRVERARPAPRAGMFASTADPVLDGEIYLTHGRFGREYTTRSYRYDPAADESGELAERPEHVRNRAVDSVIDGRLYVVGGHVKRYERDNYHDATTDNKAYTPPS
ncbi:hypothetical protein BRC86_09325 [Halobacteriales archaeon QS_3_64_16]|nr:MAG: hypothetical protein BRC86_09325 [Halobacteriales archaeon QS_3_64_16]